MSRPLCPPDRAANVRGTFAPAHPHFATFPLFPSRAACDDRRMRTVLPLAAIVAPALLLAACHKAEEENVEAQAENASRGLEERYNQLSAEAGNDADSAAAPYDNEAEGLLNRMTGLNAAANAAAAANLGGPGAGAKTRR